MQSDWREYINNWVRLPSYNGGDTSRVDGIILQDFARRSETSIEEKLRSEASTNGDFILGLFLVTSYCIPHLVANPVVIGKML